MVQPALTTALWKKLQTRCHRDPKSCSLSLKWSKPKMFPTIFCSEAITGGYTSSPRSRHIIHRQELHASPHIEHTPILSYPYRSIYGMSYPYVDMWASMKFWLLHLSTTEVESTGSGYLLRYDFWWRLWNCGVNLQPTLWPKSTYIFQDTKNMCTGAKTQLTWFELPPPSGPICISVSVYLKLLYQIYPLQVDEAL